MNRAKNAFQRMAGKARTAAGRLTGKRRTVARGHAEQAKADLKDDVLDVKKTARKAKRS